MTIDRIFASLPFSVENVEIVEIRCMPTHTEQIKAYLTEKLGDDPRFVILPSKTVP